MFLLKKRERICFILFITASALSVLSAVGVILFGMGGVYTAAIVCAALCACSVYCIPIYYNNAARYRTTARLYSAIFEGVGDFDTLSLNTAIEKDVAAKLLTRAINEKMITDVVIDGESISIFK